MSRWFARLKVVWPAFALAIAALVAYAMASSRTEIVCERAAGVCHWRSASFGRMTDTTFSISDVREVRIVKGNGKARDQSEVVLIFASGHETRYARAKHATAQAHFEEVRAFFDRASTVPSYRHARRGSRILFAVSLLLLGGALGYGVYGFRKRVPERLPPAKPIEPPGERARRRRRYLWIAGFMVAAVAISVVLSFVAARGQGRLVLECKTRCRMGGMECLPGGAMESPMDPGTYPIEVWTGSGSANWAPRSFTIVADETTTFVCQP